jgi:hypothetical protein
LGLPSAANSTTRARVTIRCSLLGERTILSSSERSPSVNAIGTATNAIIPSSSTTRSSPDTPRLQELLDLQRNYRRLY